jgi:Actin maturation protease-like, C-terminal domain
MSFTPGSLSGTTEEDVFPAPGRQDAINVINTAIDRALRDREREPAAGGQAAAGSTSWRAFARPVPIRLQSGPTCGLLALRMCADALDDIRDVVDRGTGATRASQVLEAARGRGFTKNGEMFSAVDLASLCDDAAPPASGQIAPATETQWQSAGLSLRAEIVRNWGLSDVAAALDAGGFFLVPYDNDRNNTPCCRTGSLVSVSCVWELSICWFCVLTVFPQFVLPGSLVHRRWSGDPAADPAGHGISTVG